MKTTLLGLSASLLLLGCGSSQQVGERPAPSEPRPEARPEARSEVAQAGTPAAAAHSAESVVVVPAHQETKAPVGPDLSEIIASIAREYGTYRRVSDHAGWAPFLCREPSSRVLPSETPENSPHGQKLYYLFAREADDYIRLPWQNKGTTAAVGQAIVKQTFHPRAVSPGEATRPGRDYATRDGVVYTTGEAAELFIMTKLDPETPGTDQGWVYGVTDREGRNVLATGRIASCMGCHERAPHDRLFGLKGR
jgi:hypothetical protein